MVEASGPDRVAGKAGTSRLRHVVPVIVGLGLFALGVYALYHLLKPVTAADVIAQVRATPWTTLLAALAATAAGYAVLIGYDCSALRYLGKKVPLRIVAVGGFLGYSFGNTIGVKKMHAAHNKALKEGLTVAILAPPHDAGLRAEPRAVSDAWLGDKVGHEKGFPLGRFGPDYLQNFPLAVVRREGRVLAFANVPAPGDGGRVSIDLMRCLPEQASGMMEFLFIKLMDHYRDAGASEFSPGETPLAALKDAALLIAGGARGIIGK